MSQIGGSLFIFGHSLQENDDHVLKCIRNSKVSTVYVSIFGDPSSQDNQAIKNRALSLSSGRRERRVLFYDAASAAVWD